MFVVMRSGATEAEINGVKGLILAEGLTPFENAGNPNVILCERGIRTFETMTRNTLDLTAVPLVHHLPTCR